MELTISIFQRRRGRHYEWHTLGLGRYQRSWRGANLAKVEAGLKESLRRELTGALPQTIEPLEVVFGRRLQTVDLSFSFPGGGAVQRVHGKFPLVLEPRPRGQAAPNETLARSRGLTRLSPVHNATSRSSSGAARMRAPSAAS